MNTGIEGESEGEEVGLKIHELPAERAVVAVGAGTRPGREAGDDKSAERARAFDAEYEWNGKPLHPFSIERESLFCEQRLAAGAPPIVKTSGDFNGFLADALRILFICSHKRENFRVLRRSPIEFQEAVDDWAEKNVQRGQQSEAISLGIRIYTDTFVTEHEPVPSGNKGDELGN
jgi:hypothetical protein